MPSDGSSQATLSDETSGSPDRFVAQVEAQGRRIRTSLALSMYRYLGFRLSIQLSENLLTLELLPCG